MPDLTNADKVLRNDTGINMVNELTSLVQAVKNLAEHEDGNEIVYPVESPISDNKLYIEDDINNIALALEQNLTLSEMAPIVRALKGGLNATKFIVHSDTYTEVT